MNVYMYGCMLVCILCYVMLCCVVLCYVILCHLMLCRNYVVLCHDHVVVKCRVIFVVLCMGCMYIYIYYVYI